MWQSIRAWKNRRAQARGSGDTTAPAAANGTTISDLELLSQAVVRSFDSRLMMLEWAREVRIQKEEASDQDARYYGRCTC